MDDPGSRILLRPGGLGRGGRLRHGVPGHGRLPESGPLVLTWPGFPPLARCVVTGAQFRRQDDGPVRHAAADGGASAVTIRKTLSAACERVSAETACETTHKAFRGTVMNMAAGAIVIRLDALSAADADEPGADFAVGHDGGKMQS